MNKYITPTIEFLNIESADVIAASTGNEAVTFGVLEGVDDEGSSTAIFNAGYWFKK